MSPDREYSAFISYRHADNATEGRKWASWLHEWLEQYEIPAGLAGGTRLPEAFKKSLYPVFRDEEELPADADLSRPIRSALENSHFLIVICSPRAVSSRFVNDEIRYFKELGKSERVLGLIIDGEPNADDEAKHRLGLRSDQECLPVSLRFGVPSPTGEIDWTVPTEPICADVRPDHGTQEGFTSKEAFELDLLRAGVPKAEARSRAKRYGLVLESAKLKVVAGIIGVPLGLLTERDQKRRRLRLLRTAWTVGTISSVFAGIFIYAVTQRATASRESAQRTQLRSDVSLSDHVRADQLLREGRQLEALPYLARSLRRDPNNSTAAASAAMVLFGLSPDEIRSEPLFVVRDESGLSTISFTPDSKHVVGIVGALGGKPGPNSPCHIGCWDSRTGEKSSHTERLEGFPQIIRTNQSGLIMAGNTSLPGNQDVSGSSDSNSSVFRGWRTPDLDLVFEHREDVLLTSVQAVTTRSLLRIDQENGKLDCRDLVSGTTRWTQSFINPHVDAASGAQAKPRLTLTASSEKAGVFSIVVDHHWGTGREETGMTEIRSFEDGSLRASFPSRGVICLSPCGRYGLSHLRQGGISLLNLRDGSTVRDFADVRFFGADDSTFSPSGDLCLLGSETSPLMVVRCVDGKVIATDPAGPVTSGGSKHPFGIAFSKDSNLLAYSNLSEIVIVGLADDARITRLKAPGFQSIRWSPDGNLIAASGRTQLSVFQTPEPAANRFPIGRLPLVHGLQRAVFSADNRHLILLASEDDDEKSTIRILETETRRIVFETSDYRANSLELARSVDGRWLAIESRAAPRIRLGNTPDPVRLIRLDLWSDPPESRTIEIQTNENLPFSESHLSSDGELLALPLYQTNSVRIINLSTRTTRDLQVKEGELQALKGFSDDAHLSVEVTHSSNPGRRTMKISIRDGGGGELVEERSTRGSYEVRHLSDRWSMIFTQFGKLQLVDRTTNLPVGGPFPSSGSETLVTSSNNGLFHVLAKIGRTSSERADHFLARLPLEDLEKPAPIWAPDLLEVIAKAKLDPQGRSVRISEDEAQEIKVSLRDTGDKGVGLWKQFREALRPETGRPD